MATPFLSDTIHYGHKIRDGVLAGIKFAERTGAETEGEFFMKDDALHFKNLSNIEIPLHENSITDISSVSPIIATTNGRAVQISIETASGTTSGIISIADYMLLTGATNTNTPGSIVRRDASGNFTAGTITATGITGLSANPSGPSAAASAGYVDNQIQQVVSSTVTGLDYKGSVRVAITSNKALDVATLSYDEYGHQIGDRILLIGQTNPAENGCYTITATGLERSGDSNTQGELTPGAMYQVEVGTYAQHFFTLTASRNYVLGTDPIGFIDVSGVNTLVAAEGLIKDGQTISVGGTEDRILVSQNSVDISPLYAGQGSIQVVGTITNGTWEGTPLGQEYGGTGATSIAGSKQALGIETRIEFTLGDGVATTFDVVHNLNNMRPKVFGWYNSKYMGSEVDCDTIDANTIRVKASLNGGATPIALNSLVIKVEGMDLTPEVPPVGGSWIVGG